MGILRLLLALCVVAAHSRPTLFGVLDAREAVVLFYVMSGFYMGLILDRKYVGPGGTRAFLINRALRLWIPYLVVLGAFLLALGVTGGLAERLAPFREAPWWLGVAAALANVFMVGQDLLYLIGFDASGVRYAAYGVDPGHNGLSLVLVFPLFTVSIEIYLYLLAPLALRSLRRTLVWFALGALYYAVVYAAGWGWRIDAIYHWAPIAWMYFALGALAYRAMQYWLRGDAASLRTRTYLGVLAILGVAAALSHVVGRAVLVIYVLALPVLFTATRANRLDRWIGELCYPVYILHAPLIELLGAHTSILDHPHAGYIVSALAVALAALLYEAVDRRVDRMRHRIAPPPVTAPGASPRANTAR